MPCAPGMAACHRKCRHRSFVFDYRTARHAAELTRDELTGGYETEADLARRELGPVQPDFKAWLEGHRQEEPQP